MKTNTTLSDDRVSLDAIVPSSGAIGTLVTLKGSGYSLVLGDDTVRFNNSIAQVLLSTDTSIEVYAPQGSGTAAVTVSVRGMQAGGPSFTYSVTGPSISGVNPSSGQAGMQVTITGVGFSTDTSKDMVYFNGVRAAVVSAGSSQIIVIAPNSTTGNISLTVNGQSTTGPVFTYTAPAPVITNVVYNGLFGITGQNFDPTASVVRIGGQIVTGFTFSDQGNGVDFLSKSSYTPASGLDNPAPVTVTVNNVSSNVYSFLFYPSITSLSSDTIASDENLTVQGVLFGSRTVASSVRLFRNDSVGNKVYWNPDPTVNSWNTNTIQVTLPNIPVSFVGTPYHIWYLEVNVGGKTNNKQMYLP